MAVDPRKLKRKRKPPAVIDEDCCSGCQACVYFCPVPGCIVAARAPEGEPWQVVMRVVEELCIGCTLCAQFCPWQSIRMAQPLEKEAGREHARYAMA